MTTTALEPDVALACMELRGGCGAVDEFLRMPGVDVWVTSRPFEACGSGGLGGDVHYVSTCATGRVARVLVADVSGHGQGVSAIAADLHRLMARHVNYLDGGQLFAALNERLGALVTGGKFATAVVLTYFAPTGTLTLSNAGHPPPLVWRAKDRRWKAIRRPGSALNLPLGILDGERYHRLDLTLDSDDLVLCYTDWLTEARGADGELLGIDGVLRLLAPIDGSRDGREVVAELLNAVTALGEANLRHDDLTLLAFRPNGGRVRVPWRDRLAAPGRIVRHAIRALREGRGLPLPDVSIANIGGALFGPLNWVGRRRGGADAL